MTSSLAKMTNITIKLGKFMSSIQSENLSYNNNTFPSSKVSPWTDAIIFVVVLLAIIILIVMLVTLIILRLERTKHDMRAVMISRKSIMRENRFEGQKTLGSNELRRRKDSEFESLGGSMKSLGFESKPSLLKKSIDSKGV